MNLRLQAVALRQSGKSYKEIQNILGVEIAKGTLSYWCKNVPLPEEYTRLKTQRHLEHLKRARQLSREVKAKARLEYFSKLKNENKTLLPLLDNKQFAKLILAILYAAEGSKIKPQGGGTVVFGNSDPLLIAFFLKLLRQCYIIDPKKLHCTVQCRDDQDTQSLKLFWSKVTGIPMSQFYKTQVDPRTKGKPTTKLDYQGVCRLEYFSAAVFWDMIVTAEVMMGH